MSAQRLAYIVAGMAAGLFLAVLTVMQFAPHAFVRFDALATGLAHPLQTLPWIQFFIVVTTLGSTTGIIAGAVLVALFIRKKRDLVTRLVLVLIGSSVSVQIIKSLIHRIRPEALPWIGALHSFSFPSGHATSAMALFGFAAVIGMRELRVPSQRAVFVVACAALILAIGISRIVLAAHYFSDVLAGYFLGAFWIGLVFLLPLPKRLGSHGVD